MTRFVNEFVDALSRLMPGGVPGLAFASLIITLLIALAAYFWPRWLPWHWGLSWRRGGGERAGQARFRFRLGALRWRWRWSLRRRKRHGDDLPADELPELPADELPDLPAEVLLLSADQLAAAGRFRESVRERLRAILRDLTDRGIIPLSPGWTLTELAAYAGQARPALAAPLRVGIDVFSEIWYGMRPAIADDDARLRAVAGEVTRLLDEPVVSLVPGGSR